MLSIVGWYESEWDYILYDGVLCYKMVWDVIQMVYDDIIRFWVVNDVMGWDCMGLYTMGWFGDWMVLHGVAW